MAQGKVLDFLDRLFRYMPPIQAQQDASKTEVKPAALADSTSTPQEDAVAGTSFYHTIPGEVGLAGLSPGQYQAVIAQAKPQDDAALQAIEQLSIKAAKGAVATTASSMAAGATLGEALPGALPSVGPGIVLAVDAGAIALAAYDMFGGDIDVNKLLGTNAAGLSPAEMQIYNQFMAQGQTQAAEAFLMKAENRLGTKQILTASGDYVMVGHNAAQGMTVADTSEVDTSMLDYAPKQAPRTLLG